MINLSTDYEQVFGQMLDATRLHLSDIKPSEWYEQNMVMPRGSAFPGPFSFDHTPFWREPLDCADKNHPAKEISIMKSAQSGGTAAVLNAIVGYTISQNPGNMMFLTGHSELSAAAFLKIDAMIDNTNIRNLIRPNVIRARNSRSGDTSKMKEYPGGTLYGGSVTNHNLLRQYDIMIMVVDDFDAAKMSSKEAGSTRELVQQRVTAFAHKQKIYYVSSPQLKGSSNIDSVFQAGDQRYYHVPCPKCGVMIVIKWKIALKDKETAGIWWDLDKNGNLRRDSVCYICQECGNSWKESHKYEINLAGRWIPSVIPREENHFSYHMSALYAPPFMTGWATYVQRYLTANPAGLKPIEKKNQTFVNVVLGEPYEQKGASPEAESIQGNIRPYEIGTVPENLSIKHGNGKIVMLTCACDLNGKDQDARLDYEVVAWAESGASYSIRHGSIGTFFRGEGEHVTEDRVHWVYDYYGTNSVWPEFEKVINTVFVTDSGRRMEIIITGVDTGHFTKKAYEYIDKTNRNVIGLKGDKENQYRKLGVDLPIFKPGRERDKLFLLDVNNIKDTMWSIMELKWDSKSGQSQPADFMNYPIPANMLYTYETYFKHYQSEHRVIEMKEGEGVASMWKKKSSNDQNHFWDVRIYNYALREIWCDMVLREATPPKKGNWTDFVYYLKLMKAI